MMAGTNQQRHTGRRKVDTMHASAIGSYSLQPVVRVSSGAPIYREMLVRFADQRNVQEAILKAEQARSIHTIDLVTLAAAIQEIIGADDKTPIAVNISPITIELCIDEIVATVAQLGGQANQLIFEITETAPILSLASVERFLSTMAAFGVRFALDDFGTGFCDIVRVSYLRVDFIKVPKAGPYGWSTMHSGDLKHLQQIAQQHASTIIAEGVETEEDAQVVQAMGIGGAQGYYFGRPRSISDDCARRQEPPACERPKLLALG